MPAAIRSIALGLLIALVSMISQAMAGQAQVGQPAPAFTLNDVNGRPHKLSDHKGKIVVLHFQRCNCPWETAYQPLLNKLARKYADKVVFIAVNSNKTEHAAQIKQYASKMSMSYPVLKDADNKVADAYNARVTPQVFVIDAKQILKYMGGIEKAPATPAAVGKSRQQYLEPTLIALLAGRVPPHTSSRPKGCPIQRK